MHNQSEIQCQILQYSNYMRGASKNVASQLKKLREIVGVIVPNKAESLPKYIQYNQTMAKMFELFEDLDTLVGVLREKANEDCQFASVSCLKLFQRLQKAQVLRSIIKRDLHKPLANYEDLVGLQAMWRSTIVDKYQLQGTVAVLQ